MEQYVYPERQQIAGRYDLISPIALMRLAVIYEEGEKKYPGHQWERGRPNSQTLQHSLCHLVLHMSGDRGEDHLAKAAWGLFAMMEMEFTHPEFDDTRGGRADPRRAWNGQANEPLSTTGQTSGKGKRREPKVAR